MLLASFRLGLALVAMVLPPLEARSASSPKPRFQSVVVTAAEIEIYKAEVAGYAGARVVERTACTLFDVTNQWSVYLFTKAGHPAHPSVFVVHAGEEHQGVSKRRTWGHTAGNQEAFNRYLAEARAPKLREKSLLAKSCSDA
jgi:hypothetical protein